MKATIVYYSRRGKTAAFAREMAMYLWTKGVSVSFCSTADFKQEMLHDCDFLLLGCWTSGWFIVNQHPHDRWVEFARQLPSALPGNLLLFSTYKFSTGSLFRRMKKQLDLSAVKQAAILKSKKAYLSDKHKQVLDGFIAHIKI